MSCGSFYVLLEACSAESTDDDDDDDDDDANLDVSKKSSNS